MRLVAAMQSLRVVCAAPLAIAYALLGWTIGLRCSADMLRDAAAALPGLIASILALIALCGGFTYVLHHIAGVARLTAYVATSPGGAASVAIIGAGCQVDLRVRDGDAGAALNAGPAGRTLAGPPPGRLLAGLHRPPGAIPSR